MLQVLHAHNADTMTKVATLATAIIVIIPDDIPKLNVNH
jgi:hypothetical protein